MFSNKPLIIYQMNEIMSNKTYRLLMMKFKMIGVLKSVVGKSYAKLIDDPTNELYDFVYGDDFNLDIHRY